MPIESALDSVGTNILWETLEIPFRLGCVYVSSLFVCYHRALAAHYKVEGEAKKRCLYIFFGEDICAGQLLVFNCQSGIDKFHARSVSITATELP